MIFKRGQYIDRFEVIFPIKKSDYAETYRVKEKGKVLFLKLFNCARLNRAQFDEHGNILEIELLKNISHRNIVGYYDSGSLLLNGGKYSYIVKDFISGETVAERYAREQGASIKEIKQLSIDMLEALKYLQSSKRPILHNDLTPQNIMIDLGTGLPVFKIIDFGYARYLDKSNGRYDFNLKSALYMSPESFNGIYTCQSDIFSIGAILYHLLYGLPPYFTDVLSENMVYEEVHEKIDTARLKGLFIPELDGEAIDSQFVKAITKSLALDVEDRFQNADDFIKAIRGEIEFTLPRQKKREDKQKNDKKDTSKDVKKEDSKTSFVKLQGNGFKDVGGLEDLKEKIKTDLIDILNNKEAAERFGVSIPNGVLLYGPPGCGKSFFAEKLAEELGCKFKCVHCSDIATPYIHGGQQKIAAIFEEARACAPSIICLEELDSLVMNRTLHNNASESGEVNEFLVQLNNCGKSGVFVIGSTNNADKIDPAVLRSGRIEYHYYLGLPDTNAREQIFRIYLKKDITESDIDYKRLAVLTDGFISADIKKIIESAGRLLIKRKQDLYTQEILEEVIATTSPSISKEEVVRQEGIRMKMEGKKVSSKKIGFK